MAGNWNHYDQTSRTEDNGQAKVRLPGASQGSGFSSRSIFFYMRRFSIAILFPQYYHTQVTFDRVSHKRRPFFSFFGNSVLQLLDDLALSIDKRKKKNTSSFATEISIIRKAFRIYNPQVPSYLNSVFVSFVNHSKLVNKSFFRYAHY